MVKDKEYIPTMSLNGFKVANNHPEPEGDDVAGDDGGAEKGRNAEDEDLGPVSIRSGEANGSSELMVDMVDVLITPLGVQHPVNPVVEVVLHQEVHHQLRHHLPP